MSNTLTNLKVRAYLQLQDKELPSQDLSMPRKQQLLQILSQSEPTDLQSCPTSQTSKKKKRRLAKNKIKVALLAGK